MQFRASVRLPENVMNDLKSRALESETSVSSEVREAINAYVTGKRVFPILPQTADKEGSFICDPEETKAFKALAKAAGLSFDKALALAVTEHLKSQQP